MRALTRYSNFIIFTLLFLLLMALGSYKHISTSLLSILPEGESKELIASFEQQENAHLLFLTVKGFDEKALKKIRTLEEILVSIPSIEAKSFKKSLALHQHQEDYKLFLHTLNMKKAKELNVSKAFSKLYEKMTNSFLPSPIDRFDPFGLIEQKESKVLPLKNGHLILGEYGYLTLFSLKSESLDEHELLYKKIHQIVKEENGTKIFSPLFYFVENSSAIHNDVNSIIFLAGSILLLLYLFILRDALLLLNTLTTLGSSALFATIILALLYKEISIFVFVFGLSISTIAIDYMFHHYLHGFYAEEKRLNREVLFGFLTTASAFFILSFTSFVLIKQITLFALFSLFFSYLLFSFLYPKIGFKPLTLSFKSYSNRVTRVKPKFILLLSLVTVSFSLFWISFDFNLRHLDYDNQSLKAKEQFFVQQFEEEKRENFVMKGESLDELLDHAETLKKEFPSLSLPLATVVLSQKYRENRAILEQLKSLKKSLNVEAERYHFKENYFENAYTQRAMPYYTQEKLKRYGIDVLSVGDKYIVYGSVKKEAYLKLLKLDYVESISLKEQFELMMQNSMQMLIFLGLLALLVILLLLYFFTKESFLYASLFLLFPLSMILLYGYFVAFNILHILMLFILLAISIDYAIYLAKKGDVLTKRAIVYSLISTFAGFGVLVFSSISALFSLGVVATIGIVSIAFLLIFLKEV